MPAPWVVLVGVGVLLLLYGIFAPERVRLEGFRHRVISQPTKLVGTSSPSAAGMISADTSVFTIVEPPAPIRVALDAEGEAAAIAAGVPLDDAAPRLARWPLLFDPGAVAIDAAARRNMVVALGALSEDWCAPIISAAYTDDPAAEVRAAALAGLRDGRYGSERDTLQIAMRSTHESERLLAIEAFGALRDYPVIEDALEDPSFGVAAAAAYQLVHGYGNDRAQQLLRERALGERTSHIADLLAIFA